MPPRLAAALVAALLLSLLHLSPHPAHAGPAGALIVSKDGVEVRRLPDPTGPGMSSAALALVAAATIEAPPAQLLELLIDYSWRKKYLPELLENRVLARGPSWTLLYHRLNPPILSERDYTLLVSWGRTGEAFWTRFQLANERGPAARPGVVRLPLHDGIWRLAPVDAGRATRVEYRLKIDLAGSVPGWLVRSRIARSIPDLFAAIRREAAQRRAARP